MDHYSNSSKQFPPNATLFGFELFIVVLLAGLLVVVVGEVLLVPKAVAQLHVFLLWLLYVLFWYFSFL